MDLKKIMKNELLQYLFYFPVFWIRFILVSRIRIRFKETNPDPGSKKSAKIMENFHQNQSK